MIDHARSTLLVTVNTFCARVYFAANVGKLSYLVIVLMGHMISVANLAALGCVRFWFFLTFLTHKIWLFEQTHKNT